MLVDVGFCVGKELSVSIFSDFVIVYCNVMEWVIEDDRIVVFGLFYIVVGVLVECKSCVY